MTSQMTERFSAPGATLVKLFGRPAEEAEAFGLRAARVRDIGVKSAMAAEVFLRALTLVSGLALALIYGLGGWLALDGSLEPGTVVTMALLINRLYAPLTALATARLDIVTAMVSFERVFEVLDIEPIIQEPAEPTPMPAGPVGVELARRRVRLPVGRQGLAGVARGGGRPRRPARRAGPPRRLVPGRARPDRGPRRAVGGGQVDDRLARAPPLRPRRRHGRAGRHRRAGPLVRRRPPHGRRGHPGRAPVPRLHPGQPRLRRARRRRGRPLGRPALRPPRRP